MHTQSLESYQHEHIFLGEHHERNERKTWAVIALCSAMMLAEVVGGLLFGSMALFADGMHMSTHAGALLIAALAYSYARRHARDERFVFGTGKLGELAGFTSAVVLAMIAALIGYESILRLAHPVAINFNQALPIAGVGLLVNIASAWLLRDDHDHAHDHSDERHAHTRDLNLRAAYVHVLADAAVSILAITGLLAGRELGWIWMDPVMGLAGACVIANWSWGLVRSAGAILLDMSLTGSLARDIRRRVESGTDRIADLHVWRVGPGHHAVIAKIVTDRKASADEFRSRLSSLDGLSHITIELAVCADH